MKDVFLDLETLGTRAGSAVIEIGAVLFDRDTGEMGTSYHAHIKPAAPFTASVKTLAWREEKGLGPIPTSGLHHRDAIFRFLDWLSDHVKVPAAELTFWSWGSLDFTLLESLLDFRNPEDELPWNHWQVLEARGFWTLAFPGIRHAERPHQALEDARAGVKDLVAALREIRFGKMQPALDGLEKIRDLTGGEAEDPERDLARIHDIAGGLLEKLSGKEAA